MTKKVILAVLILVLGAGVALFVYRSEPKLNGNFENGSGFLNTHPFRLGLDLSGGSHLVYKADVSQVESVDESMESLRNVIERRVNLFGVSEPVVQVQKGGFVSGAEEQLLVDLPGVTDLDQAIAMIGETPLLEFKVEDPNAKKLFVVGADGKLVEDTTPKFISTLLTGQYLQKATVQFDVNTRQPSIGLQFNQEGTKLFADITKNNIGKMVAIYLDGAPLQMPVVREAITDGQAVISGGFTPNEAKEIVGLLNSGALPVPITLLSKQTIGASLGGNALLAGVRATIAGFFLVALFLIFWYRLPGLVASMALSIFIAIMLALFKLIPVTLTAAGIAGFIISIGIAVDANVLIFERIKEELKSGKSVNEAVSAGFSRAWLSIRDSNISNIITAVILFWFGTSLIKGFALTLGMGVMVSMFSAITVTRIFLSALSFVGNGKVARFLFSSGISK